MSGSPVPLANSAVVLDFCPFQTLGLNENCGEETVRTAWKAYIRTNTLETKEMLEKARRSYEVLSSKFGRSAFRKVRRDGFSPGLAWEMVRRHEGSQYAFKHHINPVLQGPVADKGGEGRGRIYSAPIPASSSVEPNNQLTLQTISDQIDSATRDLARILCERNKAEADLNRFLEEVNGAKEEVDTLRNERDKMNVELKILADQIATANKQLDTAQNGVDFNGGMDDKEGERDEVILEESGIDDEERKRKADDDENEPKRRVMTRRCSARLLDGNENEAVQPGLKTVGEKKFHCHLCNKNLSRLDSLTRHLRIQHNEAGEKKNEKCIACDLCSKPYQLKRALEIHMQKEHGLPLTK